MILKSNRLSSRDFELVMKKGRIFNSALFSLKTLKNKDFLGIKASVVVSKKVAKTAVLRNKIRRRVYSVVGKELKNSKNPYFLIFFAKKGAEKASFNDQKLEILNLLENSKIT